MVYENPKATQFKPWYAISKFQEVLISSPSGSGEILAVFYICFKYLI